MCGVKMTVDSGKVTRIEGDRHDPFSRGHICPKAPALADLHDDPDRLRKPLRKSGDGWTEVEWDEALDEAARRLLAVQTQHGRHAVGAYIGNPTVHNLPALVAGPELLRGLRTKHRFSATSVDQLPHMVVAHAMFGHQLFMPVPDIDRCDYMVMLGANPLVSNGSIMTAPDFRKRFRAITERGETVVIDPRRTETAKDASRHLFIRPGTDAYFLFALVREVLHQGADLGRLESVIDGAEKLGPLAEPFTAERAERATGIAASEVEAIAGKLLHHKRAVIYGRMGVCTQRFGGLNAWLLVVINALTRHLDEPGGAMFARPAIPALDLTGPGHFGRWRSSVRDLPEFGGELPVSALAEEIEAGAIRAMVTVSGNPVLSTPNGAAVDRALSKLDFMVSVDPYLNETTRNADLILPPCSPLERPHYDLVFHALAIRNTAKYSPPLFETDAPHDGQILSGLLRRLLQGRHGRLDPRTLKARAMEAMPVERLVDLGLRFGPYGKGALGVKPAKLGNKQLGPKGPLSLDVLKDHPHGVDLGPLQPAFPDHAPRPRIDLAPVVFVQDVERLDHADRASDNGATSNGQMTLIGRRQLRNNNSWMHNAPSLMRGRERCTLLMHPDDAERLGIKSGAQAEVTSRIGNVTAQVAVSDEMMPGVVSLPHGFGHHRKGTRLGVAEANSGVSVNDLTDPAAVDELTGNAVLNGVPVEVAPA